MFVIDRAHLHEAITIPKAKWVAVQEEQARGDTLAESGSSSMITISISSQMRWWARPERAFRLGLATRLETDGGALSAPCAAAAAAAAPRGSGRRTHSRSRRRRWRRLLAFLGVRLARAERRRWRHVRAFTMAPAA